MPMANLGSCCGLFQLCAQHPSSGLHDIVAFHCCVSEAISVSRGKNCLGSQSQRSHFMDNFLCFDP